MSARLSNQRVALPSEAPASFEQPCIPTSHPLGSGWPQPAVSSDERERLAFHLVLYAQLARAESRSLRANND
jgi:hypothetical protein